jgi:hypothetical protein
MEAIDKQPVCPLARSRLQRRGVQERAMPANMKRHSIAPIIVGWALPTIVCVQSDLSIDHEWVFI